MPKYNVTANAVALKTVSQVFVVEASSPEEAAELAREAADRAHKSSWGVPDVDGIDVGEDLEHDYEVEEL